MYKLIFLSLIIVSIFSKEIIIQENQWKLLGAVRVINVAEDSSQGCLIYRWNGNKWLTYNKLGLKEIMTINPSEGFWATGEKGECVVNLKMNDTSTMVAKVFNSITVEEHTALEDVSTKLQWVNSSPGCLPYSAGISEESIKTQTNDYCSNLVFLKQNDWRVPTATELSMFLIKANKYNEKLFYKNAGCPRLIGLDMTTYNASDIKLSKIITVNTHNNPPIGEIKPWVRLNAGIRCVR